MIVEYSIYWWEWEFVCICVTKWWNENWSWKTGCSQEKFYILMELCGIGQIYVELLELS